MLADMLTIQEEFGHLKGIKLVYMGDARYNMGNSLMIASAKMGMDFVACAPKKYFPNAELVAQCEEYAKESGATITLTEDVKEGTKDADVIYTDVWVSMGEPDSVWEERIHDLTPYTEIITRFDHLNSSQALQILPESGLLHGYSRLCRDVRSPLRSAPS